MRSRVWLPLAAAAALVMAICELESVATAHRWDPSDLGRRSGLSCRLLPEPPPGNEHALITVQVQGGGDVRTYRYWLAPCEKEFEGVILPGGIESDGQAAGMDGSTAQELAGAAP